MSEQQSEPTSGETGIVGAGPAAPDQEATSPKPDAAKVEAAKVEATKPEASKIEAPKVEAVNAETTKAEPPRIPGKLLVMSSGARAWAGDEPSAEPEAVSTEASSGKRRMSAMAAVVALATVAGAMGGALATAGLGHFLGSGATSNNLLLEASVARIDADILALKAGAEHTSKAGVSQFNKTSDRLEKVEKAQAEPAAKLARLSEAVEKLRAAPAPAVAAVPAASREITGTITPPATAAAAVPLPVPFL